MSTQNDKKNEHDVETTGHSWDGIEEYNNPLPRWWLWTFYATIVWGVLYTIAYPAWPLISEATPGLLGFSTREQVQRDIAAVDEANAAIVEELAQVELASLSQDPELQTFAVNAGAAVFRNNCSQCHGSGAAGAPGYPNLLDDAWLWGGTIDDIAFTVAHGIRNEQSPDARYSEMPAFGDILEDAQIAAVVQHVRAISGQEHDATLAGEGAQVFEEQCAACHGADGTGDNFLGAPNLTDAIWLYGGDVDTLTETVTYSRFGVMPAWAETFRGPQGLTEAEIKAVAAYVHGLGGGQQVE
ncbi:cytochrome-c oxidase, cbb3-type subunit III [Tranquillimonas alkanivorans]|uniref:Cbb3-type cytochrome c oxidase subunit n=1 Tax=Tranquillimonas alkanivorans TaxID=441119 RepID=A0A1I5KGY9_9RHOB|nr:cytochrome-c oxidase, cbb3-type subunit III [Tranquillimonas alkanivorans]SFO84314.1 cytochrome c oxidase cbb3-type subunit 3 [Tranquillimonas alkanivorans]